MHQKTRKLLASLEKRLWRLRELQAVHCGHDETMEAANRQHLRIVMFIEREVEALCEKAGEP